MRTAGPNCCAWAAKVQLAKNACRALINNRPILLKMRGTKVICQQEMHLDVRASGIATA